MNKALIMAIDEKANIERRVLFVAPTQRDGQVTRELLEKAGLTCFICRDARELAREILRGAGAVLLAEEFLKSHDINLLIAALAEQPTWSDLGVVLLIRNESASGAVAH